MAKTNKVPESLKVQLTSARRLRPFGSREIEIFEALDVVELPRIEALRHIANGVCDGVDASTRVASSKKKTAKKSADDGAAD